SSRLTGLKSKWDDSSRGGLDATGTGIFRVLFDFASLEYIILHLRSRVIGGPGAADYFRPAQTSCLRMEFRKILTLRGPNIWSRRPVLEAWVDLQDLKGTSSESVPGFNDRLMAWLPTMIEHRCSVGERGGFFQRLRDGTYPAHILEHIAIELQTLAGTPVGFGK